MSQSLATYNYVVYNKDFGNKDQESTVWALLRGLASPERTIYGSGSSLGMAFWSLAMTPENAKKVQGDPNVKSSIISTSKALCIDDTRLAQSCRNSRGSLITIPQTFDMDKVP